MPAEVEQLSRDITTLQREIRRLRRWKQAVAAGDSGIRANAIQGVIPASSGGSAIGGSPLGAVTMWENNSGGVLNRGSVVIQDGDRLCDATTTADDTDVIGILDDDAVAAGDDGRVRHTGYQAVVLVQGAVVAGQYLRASATSGRAEDAGASRTVGTFGIALTANGGGAGTVAAFLDVGLQEDPAGAVGSRIQDPDNDTSVDTDTGGIDEDIVRVRAGGNELARFLSTRIIRLFNDANFQFDLVGGNPRYTVDAGGDRWQYLRPSDEYQFLIAGLPHLLINTDGIDPQFGTFINVSQELTIAAGSVAAFRFYHSIDTQGDAGTDDLDSITGGTNGKQLRIRPEHDARDVVVKHNTGTVGNRILLADAADYTMDAQFNFLDLQYDTAADSGNGAWVEVHRSTVGGGGGTGFPSAADIWIQMVRA